MKVWLINKRVARRAPVVAVAGASDGDVELHLAVLVVRLRLSQVPLDPRASQHHATGGERMKMRVPPS